MKEAGWGPSSGEFDESKSAFALDEAEEQVDDVTDAVAGEIPDWLQQIAPPGAIEDPAEIAESELDFSGPSTAEGEIPDWLQDATQEKEDTPDWLAPAAIGAAGAVAGLALSDDSDESDSDGLEELGGSDDGEEIPDWLAGIEKEEESIRTLEDELPDWLSEIAEDEEAEPEDEGADLLTSAAVAGAAIAGAAAIGAHDEETAEAEEAEIPDWLQEVAEDEPIEPSAEAAAELEVPEAVEEAIPDWLQEAVADEPEAEAELELPAEETEIPDWLSEVAEDEEAEPEDEGADLLTSAAVAGAAIAGAAAIGAHDEETAEAEEAEIPDWLQEVAEDEPIEPSAEAAAELEVPEAVEEAIPDWLQEAVADEPEAEAELELPAEETEIPDWLSEVAEDEEAEPEDEGADLLTTAAVAGAAIAGAAAIGAHDEETAEAEDESSESVHESEIEWGAVVNEEISEISGADIGEIDSELPGWLQDIPEEASVQKTTTESAASAEEIPAWLQDISDDVPTIAGETEIQTKVPDEQELDDLPDWMQDIADEETLLAEEEEAPIERTDEEAVTPEIDDADAAMAWLESLAAKQGVSEDELLTSPEERSETPPDWVQEAKEEFADAEIDNEPIQEISAEPEQIEATLTEVEVTETLDDQDLELLHKATDEEEVEPESEGTGILGAAVVAGAAIAGAIAATEYDDENLEKDEEETITATADTDLEMAEETSEVSEETEEGPEFDDADAAMAWLESLAAKQGVSEEELLTSPTERSEKPPKWVQEATEEASQAELQESSEDTITNVWPSELASEEPEIRAEVTEENQIPDWLQEDTEEKVETETLVAIAADESEITEDASEVIAEAEEVTDFNDVDAAMAWLESLAAKQGVSEDELLTSPDERSEIPPDWVQEASEAEDIPSDAEPAIVEELSEWISEVPEDGEAEKVQDIGQVAETITTEEAAADIDFENADAALAWLESLAAKQGVSEEELLTSPEERSETPPAWVQESASETVTSATSESLPSADEIEIPTSEGSISVKADEDTSFEPPTWISDGEIPEDDDYSWLPADVSEAMSAEAENQIDLNQASLIQLERLPGVGFRRAQAITSYRDEHGNFTHFDELYNVSGLDEETIELLKTRVIIDIPESSQEPEAMAEEPLFAPRESEPEDELHQQQLDAQTKLLAGDVEGAIQ
ncbi:MAG: helix-hairpin-helix domain-containing protein, partial [bacterium]